MAAPTNVSFSDFTTLAAQNGTYLIEIYIHRSIYIYTVYIYTDILFVSFFKVVLHTFADTFK